MDNLQAWKLLSLGLESKSFLRQSFQVVILLISYSSSCQKRALILVIKGGIYMKYFHDCLTSLNDDATMITSLYTRSGCDFKLYEWLFLSFIPEIELYKYNKWSKG